MEQTDRTATDGDRCLVCGQATVVALCSVACRARARDEVAQNGDRISGLRALGFDACLDEVRSIVRRDRELTRALDAPALLDVEPVPR